MCLVFGLSGCQSSNELAVNDNTSDKQQTGSTSEDGKPAWDPAWNTNIAVLGEKSIVGTWKGVKVNNQPVDENILLKGSSDVLMG